MLTPDQKKKLKLHYKELKKWNTLRKEGVECWDEYYSTLKKIKYLLRYGR